MADRSVESCARTVAWPCRSTYRFCFRLKSGVSFARHHRRATLPFFSSSRRRAVFPIAFPFVRPHVPHEIFFLDLVFPALVPVTHLALAFSDSLYKVVPTHWSMYVQIWLFLWLSRGFCCFLFAFLLHSPGCVAPLSRSLCVLWSLMSVPFGSCPCVRSAARHHSPMRRQAVLSQL